MIQKHSVPVGQLYNPLHILITYNGMNEFFQTVRYIYMTNVKQIIHMYIQVKSLENYKVYNIELCMCFMIRSGIHNANDSTKSKDIINKEYINDDREKQRLGINNWYWHYGNELTNRVDEKKIL